jgi:hypothetical protein
MAGHKKIKIKREAWGKNSESEEKKKHEKKKGPRKKKPLTK